MKKILIAEDDKVSHAMLVATLTKWGYEVVACTDGTDALGKLSQEDAPKLAILDWMMPGMDGIDVCSEIRLQNAEPYTYIILLTAKDSKEDMVKGLAAGADDYVTKPVNVHELKARLRAGIRVIDLQNQLLQSREEYRDLAIHDSLTGISNRAAILEALARELKRAERHKKPVSVIMLDLDHFKKVNDTYGHPSGDTILRETAERLRESMRAYDEIGRYGGEEFLVVLPDCDLSSAKYVAERIRVKLEETPIQVEQALIPVTCSLGVASNEAHAALEVDELIRSADEALYAAKEQGRNCVVLAQKNPVHTGSE